MEGRGLHLKAASYSNDQISRREVAPSLGCWSVGKLGAITESRAMALFAVCSGECCTSRF